MATDPLSDDDIERLGYRPTPGGWEPLDPSPRVGGGGPAAASRSTPGRFDPRPLDLEQLTATPGLDAPAFLPGLEELGIARGARVLVAGEAGSGKSLWILGAVVSPLTRRGVPCVLIDQENPAGVLAQRLRAFGPDLESLTVYSRAGFDLSDDRHAEVLIKRADGAGLVVLDSLRAVWSGDENSNGEIAALFSRTFVRVVEETGAALIVVDHLGHPQAFARGGSSTRSPRGASAKVDQADVVLGFRKSGRPGVTIEPRKHRFLFPEPEPLTLDILERPDGTLEYVRAERSADERVAEVVEEILRAITDEPGLTVNGIRGALKANERRPGTGEPTITAALRMLEQEQPARVRVEPGPRRAKRWFRV